GGAGRRGVHLRGDAAVELAHAAALWLARHHFLAGARLADLEQNSLRRVPLPARSGPALAPPHDGALGENDARTTRTVSRRNARALRKLWGAIGVATQNRGLIFFAAATRR